MNNLDGTIQTAAIALCVAILGLAMVGCGIITALMRIARALENQTSEMVQWWSRLAGTVNSPSPDTQEGQEGKE
jgi:hypothetical protein